MGDSHSNLLHAAKNQQKQSLTEAEVVSNQLRLTLEHLLRSNSVNDYNGSSVLDKITTIHEIDQNINKQLDKDIAVNFEKLMDSKTNLQRILNKSHKHLKSTDGNIIEQLQRRSELIDQDLRILAQTLKIVKENQELDV